MLRREFLKLPAFALKFFLRIHFQQVRSHKTGVAVLARLRQIPPASYRAPACIFSARTDPREMVDPVVAHRIVERGFLIRIDMAHRNEIVPTMNVQFNSAVGLAGMVELADKASMQDVLMLADL